MRILLVEDNADSRRLLVKQLTASNHQVTSAENGQEALLKARSVTPEIVVTDILMPEMDGYELCIKWKMDDKLKPIPLVFYSATYTSDEDEQFALSLGGDAFIRKPADFDVFMRILSEVLEEANSGKRNSPSNKYPEFLIEHNRRLLSKLYAKVGQLEADIIERKKAEEAIRTSEEKFRQFFENEQVMCYLVSIEGIMLEVNNCACNTLGYSKEELVGLPFSRVFAPESLQRALELNQLWIRTGCTDSEELVVITRSGQRRDVLFSSGAIRDKDAKLLSRVSVQKDITELKQSRDKAAQVENLINLNKAKSELLSVVAHELRTPLQSIKGFIETLIETDVKWSTEQQLEFLNEADREVDILNLLVRDLLDVSRIEAGKMRLEKQNCRLEDILEVAQARLKILCAHHKLEINIAPGLPDLQADKLRIAQVITNLIENATKFSPRGSRITLSASASPEDLTVAVTDCGIGMDPETIDQLFTRFYQAEQGSGEKKGGTGLGLSICRGIMQAHNGKMWVNSALGGGSTFFFSLPVG